MARFTLTKEIAASPDRVFAVFSDLESAPDNLSGVNKLEVLTDGPVGKGTRFRETRTIFKREATEEMEITAFAPGKGYAVEAESCGAHYRTEFRFQPTAAGTRVEMDLDSRPITFMAKLMSPLAVIMTRPMKKLMDKDLEELKTVAERV